MAIAARGTRRCLGTRPAKLPIQVPLKRLATLPGLTRRSQLPSLRNQPAHRALATMEKRSLKRALT